MIVAGCVSCQRTVECTNSNPLFDSSDYTDPYYKRALADSLASIAHGAMKYTLADFSEHDGRQYINVYIEHGNKFCAEAMLLLPEEGFGEIRAKKGMGYSGAELEGLSIRTLVQGDSICFLAERVDRIND